MTIGQAIKQAISEDYKREGRRTYVGISEIPYCPVKTYRKHTREEKTELGDEVLIKFLVGRASHEYVQALLWKQRGNVDGFKYRKAEKEIQIKVDGFTLFGHADLIATMNGKDYVVDFKMVGAGKFRNILTEPDEYYVDQVMLYAYGLGLSHWCLTYVNRETGAVKDHTGEVDKERIFYLTEKYSNIMIAIEREVEPVIPFEDQSESWECSYCQYCVECWGSKEYDKNDDIYRIPADQDEQIGQLKREKKEVEAALKDIKSEVEANAAGARIVGDNNKATYTVPKPTVKYDPDKLQTLFDPEDLKQAEKITQKKPFYTWR
jgi:hypothetical protein